MSVIAQDIAEQTARSVGRPNDYKPIMLRKAKEYLKDEYTVIPTVAGLCAHLGIARATIYRWMKNEQLTELKDTVDRMNVLREKLLLENGLLSKWNSNMCKLILTTNHGYTENKQQDTGITVNVNRSAAITHDDNTLTIDVEE